MWVQFAFLRSAFQKDVEHACVRVYILFAEVSIRVFSCFFVLFCFVLFF